MQEGLNSPDVTGVKSKFADYVIFGLSRNVRTELVKFVGDGKVKTRVADGQFKQLLLQNRFVAELKSTGDPKIEIYLADENGNKRSGRTFIMQIRYKLKLLVVNLVVKKFINSIQETTLRHNLECFLSK